jgi:hypothetical protein
MNSVFREVFPAVARDERLPAICLRCSGWRTTLVR